MKKSNFHFVRQINEISVLRIIRDEGPISRSDIARRMGVSKVIIGGIVKRLLETEILFEIGKGKSTEQGGRRPVLLQFNADAWYAIGVEIHLHHANVLVTNMNAEAIAQKSVTYSDNSDPKQILNRIVRTIERLISDPAKRRAILGVGVALPGLIDYENGCLLNSHSLISWVGFPIRSFLEEALDSTIYIENDVKAITLGEFHWGAGQDADNVIYVWLGEGIGAGIVINGDIYRGMTASAGELGYNEISALGINKGKYPILYQDQRRFGEILTSRHLEEAVLRQLTNNGEDSRLSQDDLSLTNIANAAGKGDSLARNALEEYGSLLGVLLIGVINLFNPELIILGGPVIDKSPFVLEKAIDRAEQDVLSVPVEHVQIKAGALKNRAGTLGAVGMVLQDLFKPPIINMATYRSLILPE